MKGTTIIPAETINNRYSNVFEAALPASLNLAAQEREILDSWLRG
jgi:hypothetical protein